MRIYLAGPITGKGYEEVMQAVNEKKIPLQAMGHEVYHPMLGKEFLKTETKFKAYGLENPVLTNHAIYERDKWMVTFVDIILVDLSNATRVSIGTMFEMAWASYLGKLVITVMPEGNLHEHAFVFEGGGTILPSVEAALNYIEKLTV